VKIRTMTSVTTKGLCGLATKVVDQRIREHYFVAFPL
jgi:hypothetical protein